uniref:Vesicle transport protein n=1 Tax=Salix viminalis TaxID=40686 RepID=A0A6N2KZB6_SALVM
MMDALPFRTLLHFPCTSKFTSCTRPKDAMPIDFKCNFSSLEIKRLSRRMVLKFCGFNTLLLSINPVLAAPMPEMKEPEVIRTLKLASGVKFQEIIEGEGSEAQEGDTVEVNYVCRRSNGYFVHSTVDQFSGESSPVILPLDENQIIKGLKEVLIGMKVGGKRRALIPPSVGYFGPRRSLFSHATEPLIFEVQLLKSWFSSSGEDQLREKPSSSLLADWNSYAATSDANESTNGLRSFGSLDLEAAVRSANDTVSGTLNSATSNIPSGKVLMYFGLFLATGVFFVFIAFTLFLPVIVLVPQKFAICFTLGCGFIIGSFFALKGPKNQLAHMSSKERIPFTLGFIGSMVGTLYVSMVWHSYVLSVLFSVIQVLALVYYAISYFPGGSAGLKFLSSSLASSAMRLFGR